MHAYATALAVFIAQEVIGLVLFLMVNRYLGPKGKKPWDPTVIFKGALERLVLYTSLIHDYPQMVIAPSEDLPQTDKV